MFKSRANSALRFNFREILGRRDLSSARFRVVSLKTSPEVEPYFVEGPGSFKEEHSLRSLIFSL